MALILSKEAAKSLKEWEPIPERIIFARFESKCKNTTIIQVYAPTNDAEEGVKEDFYHQLQSAYNKRKARDLTKVIGDLNAKVGSDNRNWEASMRTHGEGVINENGEMFCDFCASNELVIGERSSRTRNPISLPGVPLMGSLRTRSTMWLSTIRGGVHYRPPE